MTDSTDASSEKIALPVAVILLAGGKGQRAGFDQPKQYQRLGGRSVLEWSVSAFNQHPAISTKILVADEDVRGLLGHHLDGWQLAASGAERQQSVANAMAPLAHLADDHILLVHDAARPGVTADVMDRLIAAVAAGDDRAAIPTLPMPDTLVQQYGEAVGEPVDRSSIGRVQTPQAFRLGHLRAAHAAAPQGAATDDAQLVRASGVNVVSVMGDARLHKLTFAEDLTILNALLQTPTPMRMAVGMGYDVHKLVPDRPLWIGGITIDHTHGLLGHSDADVALHALTDAILGALADGDIGDHFPPSDAKWAGASSDRFLEFAGQRVIERGGKIEHLDLTIIAEAPKIGPHRLAIRQRIAEILNIPLDYVSVKATTSEKLGFTGRREGIAAQAVATLKLPEA